MWPPRLMHVFANECKQDPVLKPKLIDMTDCFAGWLVSVLGNLLFVCNDHCKHPCHC